jgi:hypothetical protein
MLQRMLSCRARDTNNFALIMLRIESSSRVFKIFWCFSAQAAVSFCLHFPSGCRSGIRRIWPASPVGKSTFFCLPPKEDPGFPYFREI